MSESNNWTVYNKWVVLKFTIETSTRYKVLAGWRGWDVSKVWRRDSGITGVEKQAYLYGFYGASGSVCWCHSGGYGLSLHTAKIYNQLEQRFGDAVEILPENTNWFELIEQNNS